MLEPFRTDAESAGDVVLRADALACLAACWLFGGRREQAGPVLEEALTTLEAMQAWAALTGALITRAAYLIYGGRRQEGRAVLRHASRLAEDHDLPYEALRTSYNLAACLIEEHDFEGALAELERGRALAQERGDRSWDERMRQQSLIPMMIGGRWREATAVAQELMTSYDEVGRVASAHVLAQIAGARGDDELTDRCLAIAGPQEGSAYADVRCASLTIEGHAELGRGSPQAALARVRPILDTPAIAGEIRADAYLLCVESALALGDETVIDELQAWCASLPPAEAPALLLAGRERLLAEQAYRRGEPEACERHEQSAIDRLRSVGARPLLARALLDRCRRRDDPAAEAEAREIIEELGAVRWLEAIQSGDAVSTSPRS